MPLGVGQGRPPEELDNVEPRLAGGAGAERSHVTTPRRHLYSFFYQKLSLDYTERHRRPRKLSTPMSYLADHTRCRGRADI